MHSQMKFAVFTIHRPLQFPMLQEGASIRLPRVTCDILSMPVVIVHQRKHRKTDLYDSMIGRPLGTRGFAPVLGGQWPPTRVSIPVLRAGSRCGHHPWTASSAMHWTTTLCSMGAKMQSLILAPNEHRVPRVQLGINSFFCLLLVAVPCYPVRHFHDSWPSHIEASRFPYFLFSMQTICCHFCGQG